MVLVRLLSKSSLQVTITMNECFICAGTEFTPEWGGRLVKSHYFKKCAGCGVVVAEREDGRYDENLFEDCGEYMITGPSTPDAIVHKIGQRKRPLFKRIIREFGPDARVLDFGCGAGFFVQAARNHGINCDGVEVSNRMRDFTNKQFGFLPASAIEYSDTEFDVIHMDNVIEHLAPEISRGLMEEIVERIKPGGLLIGDAPNYNSWNIRLLGERDSVINPPSHSVYFLPDSLDRYLRTLGLSPVSIRTKGLNIANFFRPPGEYSFLERPTRLLHHVATPPLKVIGRLGGIIASIFGAGFMIDFTHQKTH